MLVLEVGRPKRALGLVKAGESVPQKIKIKIEISRRDNKVVIIF